MASNKLVTFSHDGWPMHGIVHLPPIEPRRRIGVVVLQGNLDSSPKFGAHWMFRRVSDALAEAGYFALRFDDRGTCDSAGECDLKFRDRITDLCAAAKFFRSEYRLEGVVFWGLCMGAAVAVHASSQLNRHEKPEAMILCSVLAHPDDASLPEFGYRATTVSAFLRNSGSGNLSSKMWRFLTSRSYRRNAYECVKAVIVGYAQQNPTLSELKSDVSRVGGLLTRYDRPMLMIFGEKDPFWISFTKWVNPDDKLGLSHKKIPPKLLVMEDGDHVFASKAQMSELIESTVEWLNTLWAPTNLTSTCTERPNGILVKPAID